MTIKKPRGRPPTLNDAKRRQVYLDDATWYLMKKCSGDGNVSAWIRKVVWSTYELSAPLEMEEQE